MSKCDMPVICSCRLVFNSFIPVGLEDYVTYFKNRFGDFTYLRWKFPHSKGKSSSVFTTFKNGKEVYSKKLFSIPAFTNRFMYFASLPINYFVYICQAIVTLWKGPSSKKPVVFIGVNYYCAFCGILLKKLGRVDYVIYRVMDFFPLPPMGIYRYLNRLFYVFDKFCLKNADSVWFTTEGHIIGREKYGYYDRRKAKYKIIPLGIDLRNFVNKPVNDEGRMSLIYCGVVSGYHMLELVFEVVEDLKKRFPVIQLNIVGTGPDTEYFKNLVHRIGLEKNVKFFGFLEEGKQFDNIMSNNILGIALYRDEENFMKYTEPAKVKYYLTYGIPAIISQVPKISEELNDLRVSFSVKNNASDIVSVISKYIEDRSLQEEYKRNIEKYVKSIDIFNLLEKAVFQTLRELRI